jgi:hypothetical protein
MRPDPAGARLPVPVSADGPLHCLAAPSYDLLINGRCTESLALLDSLEPGVRGFGDGATSRGTPGATRRRRSR